MLSPGIKVLNFKCDKIVLDLRLSRSSGLQHRVVWRDPEVSEAMYSSETSGCPRTTRLYNPEHRSLHDRIR
jgi:hypothetical protein